MKGQPSLNPGCSNSRPQQKNCKALGHSIVLAHSTVLDLQEQQAQQGLEHPLQEWIAEDHNPAAIDHANVSAVLCYLSIYVQQPC